MNELEYLMHVADMFNSQIIIHVRNFFDDPNAIFYAQIEHVEVSDTPGFLTSKCGNGATADVALHDYHDWIRGKVLVKHAGCSNEIRRRV